MQKFVKGGGGCENDFLQTLRDCRGENLFLEINVLRAISGDLFATVTSVMAENDISRFPEKNLRGRDAHRSSPLYVTSITIECNLIYNTRKYTDSPPLF